VHLGLKTTCPAPQRKLMAPASHLIGKEFEGQAPLPAARSFL
jgi:hypothetical protein